MTRTFKWEHSGKGKKRAFSVATNAHYVWKDNKVISETSKGSWKLVGLAETLSEADKISRDYDELLAGTIINDLKNRKYTLQLTQDYKQHSDIFKEFFSGGAKLRAVYECFCELRKNYISLDEIEKHMPGVDDKLRPALINCMEVFRKEGRR